MLDEAGNDCDYGNSRVEELVTEAAQAANEWLKSNTRRRKEDLRIFTVGLGMIGPNLVIKDTDKDTKTYKAARLIAEDLSYGLRAVGADDSICRDSAYWELCDRIGYPQYPQV